MKWFYIKEDPKDGSWFIISPLYDSEDEAIDHAVAFLGALLAKTIG